MSFLHYATKPSEYSLLTRCTQLPVSAWPKDPNLAEVGQYVNMTLENDIEDWFSALEFASW